MAYTTIDKSTDYFNTKLYTGNGSTQSITGIGFQPDWTWIKYRGGTGGHNLFDVVRGATKRLRTNSNGAPNTGADTLTAFDSDGFSLGADTTGDGVNISGYSNVSWNWLAAGTAPSKTYTVKVVSDSGNKYRFDDFGTSAVTLEISEGGTYTFDQSDSSNSGHPLRFSTTSDGTHGGGSEYTTGVTTTGTPGSSGAQTVITVAASAPTLYYYCSSHSGMGGQANTPTTNSFSDFSGSIQSNVSPNTTAGFSIVSYTGTGSNATVGHGLGVAPSVIILKGLVGTREWAVYHTGLGGNTYGIHLNSTAARSTETSWWNSTSPTSSVFTIGTSGNANDSGNGMIAYCFAEKKGYSKFGKYTGNANADGIFVYTGFKPAFFMVKKTDATDDWRMFDNKRPGRNVIDDELKANTDGGEGTGNKMDFLSNGVKFRISTSVNTSNSFIYMAFAENPFVTSGVKLPTTAG